MDSCGYYPYDTKANKFSCLLVIPYFILDYCHYMDNKLY